MIVFGFGDDTIDSVRRYCQLSIVEWWRAVCVTGGGLVMVVGFGDASNRQCEIVNNNCRVVASCLWWRVWWRVRWRFVASSRFERVKVMFDFLLFSGGCTLLAVRLLEKPLRSSCASF